MRYLLFIYLFIPLEAINKDSKIYIAGHNGMVGHALIKILTNHGFNNLIYRTSKELDLRCQKNVDDFFSIEKPEYVFLAAAKVGGALTKKNYPANYLYDNIMIICNVINAAAKNNVKKMLFIASASIYPIDAPQPINEESFMEGKIEPLNELYALSKIIGIKLCQSFNAQFKTNFISCAPNNLYGPHDNFNPETAHVLPALINRFHKAKVNNQDEVEIWGTGEAKREFIFVDDLAEACLFLMKNYNSSQVINIGCNQDISIKDLAKKIKLITDFKGHISFDHSKPEGVRKRLLDSSNILKEGWVANVPLDEGLKQTYQWLKSKEKE